MTPDTRVLVVDDHPLMRAALREVLERAGGIEVAAEAGSGEDALAALRQSHPDVVLLDMSLPDTDGITLLAAIKDVTDCPVVFLSATTDARSVQSALDAGASGYLSKLSEPTHIVSAVRDAAAGRMPLSADASTALISVMQRSRRSDRPEITPREREVWRLLGSGASNRDIAEKLFISVHTVKFHTRNLFRKLGFRSRYEALSAAHNRGLETEPDQ